MNLNNYNDTQFNAVNYAGGLRLLMANKHDSVLCLFHLYFFPFSHFMFYMEMGNETLRCSKQYNVPTVSGEHINETVGG